jgi:hypothetical protein
MPYNENNKDSMDELNKIIDRYTEGNYLIGKTAKEEMAKDILALFGFSQHRELLLAYHKYLDSLNDPTVYNASESMIDDYLSNNWG